MTVIAKNDNPAAQVDDLWRTCFSRVVAHIDQCRAHPARTVVLLPYAQLMAVAQSMWAQHYPNGFMPRWETTSNWAGRCVAWQPQQDDWAAEVALDTLTARSLLQRAGLQQQVDMLVGPLLEVMRSLAPCVAAIAPDQRKTWAHAARGVLCSAVGASDAWATAGAQTWLHYETAINTIALEWALASRYPTDVLFTDAVHASVDALVVVHGLQPAALALELGRRFGDGRCLFMPLHALSSDEHERTALENAQRHTFAPIAQQDSARWHLHACDDAEDEALQSASLIARHVSQGRVPVALVANDRALTRRIQAYLQNSGIRVKDENGWTLSTTRAAANIMAWLQAAAWDASADSVVDAIKQSPSLASDDVALLEHALRKARLRLWRQVLAWRPDAQGYLASLNDVVAQIQDWRAHLITGRQPLSDWLRCLQRLLAATGLWAALQADAAGVEIISTLYLEDSSGLMPLVGSSADESPAPEGSAALPYRRADVMDLSQFTRWVRDVLESARFKPDMSAEGDDAQAPVVVVPLQQLLGRPFQAVVIPGCDERRLPAAPEPTGAWTKPQRQVLGLPDRHQLALVQQAAWQTALGYAWVDMVWRKGDEAGEPILASPLVLGLNMPPLATPVAGGDDPRAARCVLPLPTVRPAPRIQSLPIPLISSTAYSNLRACPYRFVALHAWGLQEDSELDSMASKRDFGTWLHAVLQRFHESEKEGGASGDHASRVALMDFSAQEAMQKLGWDEAEFLPFIAGWPALRDGYLTWLTQHESESITFTQAEVQCRQAISSPTCHIELVGKIDRVDQLPFSFQAGAGATERDHSAHTGQPSSAALMVMDYKTEGIERTRKRIKQGAEDTQLAFYAALLGSGEMGEVVEAAYINVGEKGATTAEKVPDILALREALVEGIRTDFSRIAAGAAMPALGEGQVCETCHARGLCRKDFWA